MSETVESSSEGHDWNWPQKAHEQYVRDNYERLSPEDMYIGGVAISVLASYAHVHNLLNKLPFATHVAVGAVPRGSALSAPLIKPREQGGYLDVSDYQINTTEETRSTMAQLAIGNLGLWHPHQESYTAHNPLWAGSFQTAGQLADGQVHQKDMRMLDPNSTPYLGVEYGPESAANNEKEYLAFMDPLCEAVEPGGLLVYAYVKESGKYDVGDVEQPAYSVTPGYIEAVLHKRRMSILFNGATDPSHTIRIEGDTHSYGGLGIVLAVKNAKRAQ